MAIELYRTPEQIIRDVALYLRKSRGELDKDLEKHRTELVELCKVKGWRFTEYAEIGTSDSIDLRPEMLKLLKDVEEGLYDAVVVMDYDRLSRGDGEEQARIKNTLRRSETFIITPLKVYDLNDDNDDMYSDFEGLMGRFEYKQIKKRLRRGKKQGSRRGDWTNGTPPYPYEYQEWYDEKNKDMYRNEKGLVVNRDKVNVYRLMVDLVLNKNLAPYHIAHRLNKDTIPAPRGDQWHGHTIQRMLLDETHLGKVISNKSKGDGHRVKRKDAKDVEYLPKREWIIVENCHEAVKTLEEHNKLQLFFARETSAPVRRTKSTFTLSGLVRCKKCGHLMTFANYTVTESGKKMARNIFQKLLKKEAMKRCWYRNGVGESCTNKGIEVNFILDKIHQRLDQYEELLRQKLNTTPDSNESVLKEMAVIRKELSKFDSKVRKVNEGYEADVYTAQEAKDRKAELKKQKGELETRLELLQIKLETSNKKTDQEKLDSIEKFRENMKQDNLTPEKLNEYYRSIISHIIWERDDDKINLEVVFL